MSCSVRAVTVVFYFFVHHLLSTAIVEFICSFVSVSLFFTLKKFHTNTKRSTMVLGFYQRCTVLAIQFITSECMSEYCVPYREHTSHNGVKCKCSAFSQVVTHFILPHIIAVAGVNIDKWMSAHSQLSLFGVACYIDLDKHAYVQLHYDFMCGKHWAKRQHIGYCRFQYACNAC